MEPEFFRQFGPYGVVLFVAWSLMFRDVKRMGNPGCGPPPKPRGKLIEKWFVREPLAAAIRHEGEVKVMVRFWTSAKPLEALRGRREGVVIEWWDEIGRCEDIVYLDELEHEVTYEPLKLPEKKGFITELGNAVWMHDVRPIGVESRPPPVTPVIIIPKDHTMDSRIAAVERQQEFVRQSLSMHNVKMKLSGKEIGRVNYVEFSYGDSDTEAQGKRSSDESNQST